MSGELTGGNFKDGFIGARTGALFSTMSGMVNQCLSLVVCFAITIGCLGDETSRSREVGDCGDVAEFFNLHGKRAGVSMVKSEDVLVSLLDAIEHRSVLDDKKPRNQLISFFENAAMTGHFSAKTVAEIECLGNEYRFSFPDTTVVIRGPERRQFSCSIDVDPSFRFGLNVYAVENGEPVQAEGVDWSTVFGSSTLPKMVSLFQLCGRLN